MQRDDRVHDIWNPWHGCRKKSEGCDNCYMYFLDRQRGEYGGFIYKTKNGFDYPLKKDRKGNYKIRSGELIRVCMTSDFFIEEADPWRADVWNMIRTRSDVIFYILTKRPERAMENLPRDWGEGWENVSFNVTCENQQRADERLPILMKIPAKHKGVMCAPFIGKIHMEKYLEKGQIEQVICGGENYSGARPCNYDWVISLREQCKNENVKFSFIETGTVFIKDGKKYFMPDKKIQSEMAYKSGISYEGKPVGFILKDRFGREIDKEILYKPHYRDSCMKCGSRTICNGCSDCGKCEKSILL